MNTNKTNTQCPINNFVLDLDSNCPECGKPIHLHVKQNAHTYLGVPLSDDEQPAAYPAVRHAAPVAVNKRKQRNLADLKAAGIPTDGLFALNIGGVPCIGKSIDGVITPLEDDDPIFAGLKEQIERGGRLFEKHLFRQHITAILMKTEFIGHWYRSYNGEWSQYSKAEGLHKWLKNHRYEYQWKMITKELQVHVWMKRNGDAENFTERNLFFNKALAEQIMKNYIEQLTAKWEDLRIRHHQGTPYRRMPGNIDVYDCDFDDVKEQLRKNLDKIAAAKTESDLYLAVRDCRIVNIPSGSCAGEHVIKLHYAKMCREFMDAYKGYGAYSSMKNLIQFSNLRWHDEVDNELSEGDSLEHIWNEALDCVEHGQGYRLLGMFKQLINDNDVDPIEMVKGWRKDAEERKAEANKQ